MGTAARRPVAGTIKSTSPHARAVACALALATALASFPASAQLARAEPVFVGQELGESVGIAFAPGADDRMFVFQRLGKIQIIENGRLCPTPFLDLSDVVLPASYEDGLLGMAFHPDYASNGQFYVLYTRYVPFTVRRLFGGPVQPVTTLRQTVVEYTVTGPPAAATVADPASRRIVYVVSVGPSLHCGGWIGFAPDGKLLVALGDGLRPAMAQDVGSPRGKLLRIDVDGRDPGRQYAIPPDNPFAAPGVAGLDEIWALGLRNPWRCSFDRLTGDLWIGDVGTTIEEINVEHSGGPGGRNYGWSCYEGASLTGLASCAPSPIPVTMPVHEFGRPATASVVVGGYVYRGALMPRLVGHYIFGDYLDGRMLQFPADSPPGPGEPANELFDRPNIMSLGEDSAGELYFVTGGGFALTPSVFRVVAEPCSRADVTSGSEPGVRGYLQPNGVLGPEDFFCYLQELAAGNTGVCDLTAGAIPGQPGYAIPDGVLNNDDFFCYLNIFAAGC